MSAFVAFNGFPGEDVQAPIQTLLVPQSQASVPVPAKPVGGGVLAAKRTPSRAAAAHRVAVKQAHSPTASTGPVVHRTAPNATQPAPAPTAPSGSSGGGAATPAAQTTPLASTSPTAPTGTDPQLPPITLPSLLPPPPQSPPPGDSQLPIDTSSITGLLGGS